MNPDVAGRLTLVVSMGRPPPARCPRPSGPVAPRWTSGFKSKWCGNLLSMAARCRPTSPT